MPTAPIGLDAQALRGDIRTEFLTMLRNRTGRDRRLNMLMDLGVSSTKRTERYLYWESRPKPKIWKRGDKLPKGSHESKSFSVTNHRWATAINWHEDDEADDQTSSLLGQARGAAEEFVTLDARIAFQILLASTNADLLPSIPNAPDGVAIFSATDGTGADRFGVSGGNIVSNSGSTAANRRDDFFAAVERMMLFQDTEGDQFHSDDLTEQGFMVVYGAHHHQQFLEAFGQRFVQGTAAAPTNVVLDSGMNVTLWPTQRMSGTDNFFVRAMGYEVQPLFRQVRLQIQSFETNRDNSDEARETLIRLFGATARFGYGVTLPLGFVRVGS